MGFESCDYKSLNDVIICPMAFTWEDKDKETKNRKCCMSKFGERERIHYFKQLKASTCRCILMGVSLHLVSLSNVPFIVSTAFSVSYYHERTVSLSS